MLDWKEINDMEYRIRLARLNAPKDIVTKIAFWSYTIIGALIGIITLPLSWVAKNLGGCLAIFTFGILFFILEILWLPFFMFILGTSWLWLHAWYTRPLLLIPGILVSLLANIYISLTPGPDGNSTHSKLSIIDSWPLSWYLLKPPAMYYEAQIVKRQDVETLAPRAYVESINKVNPALTGYIMPGLVWYDGLAGWENLATGRKIPVEKNIYVSPMWRNLSSIPMTGHINLMITYPDTKSNELSATQGQDQHAIPNNAMTVQFQPFTSTLKGTYMLTAKLSSEGKVLSTVTFILLATSEIIDNSST